MRSNINLVKLWFSVSQNEQHTRFVIRQVDPVRQWKLSATDLPDGRIVGRAGSVIEHGERSDRVFPEL